MSRLLRHHLLTRPDTSEIILENSLATNKWPNQRLALSVPFTKVFLEQMLLAYETLRNPVTCFDDSLSHIYHIIFDSSLHP